MKDVQISVLASRPFPIDTSDLKSLIEVELRKAGIQVVGPRDASIMPVNRIFLELWVGTSRPYDTTSNAVVAYEVTLEATMWLRTLVAKPDTVVATVWDRSLSWLAMPDKVNAHVREFTLKSMTEFVNEYLKANPVKRVPPLL